MTENARVTSSPTPRLTDAELDAIAEKEPRWHLPIDAPKPVIMLAVSDRDALVAALRVEREASSQLRAALQGFVDEFDGRCDYNSFLILEPSDPLMLNGVAALAVASYPLNEDAQ